MAASRDHGWWPYLAPYGAFLALVELSARLPESLAAAAAIARVAVPGLLILFFWRQGRYPELRGYRLGAGSLLDVAVGVGIAALWMAPFLLFPGLPQGDPASAFDPDRFGAGWRAPVLALRLIGFAAVTPFVEELFVRSFLIRYVDVFDRPGDFRQLPMARYTLRSFVVTVVWFTATHVPWEWIVAAPTGVIFNLWLYRRGHLGSPILAHAVANATIWAAVVWSPGDLWRFL